MNSYYMHLDAFDPGLSQGQYIEAGTLIGYVGNTGGVVSKTGGDGSHLHFEQHMPAGEPYYEMRVPPRRTVVEPCFSRSSSHEKNIFRRRGACGAIPQIL